MSGGRLIRRVIVAHCWLRRVLGQNGLAAQNQGDQTRSPNAWC